MAGVLPYLWVPNSGDGTVSKVDTVDMKELARYRTGPEDDAQDLQPVVAAVDLAGNCWVGNRGAGTVVKIGLSELDGCVDRDTGADETCRGRAADSRSGRYA